MWSAPLLDSLDLSILEFFAAHRNPVFDAVPVALGVTGTDASAMALLTGVAAAVCVVARAWRHLAAVLLAVTVARVGVGLLKDVIQRPRPPLELALLPADGFAFPSTHAAFTSAAAAAVIGVTLWRSPRRRRLVAAAFAVGVAAIGVSMVYLGSHWASDVVAGWALGVPTGYVIGWALRARSRRAAAEATGVSTGTGLKRAMLPRRTAGASKGGGGGI